MSYVEGQAECPRNGETTLVNEGDFILFNSEDVHLVRPVVGTSVRLVCIQLSFEYMRMFCKSIDSVVFDLLVSNDSLLKFQEIAETNPNHEYIAIKRDFSPAVKLSETLVTTLESLAIVDSTTHLAVLLYSTNNKN